MTPALARCLQKCICHSVQRSSCDHCDDTEAAYQIAEVYARQGNNDQAFAWLERAYRQRDAGLTAIKADRLLASLHGDARFAAMLAKLHLP